jgi:hypothetical protein
MLSLPVLKFSPLRDEKVKLLNIKIFLVVASLAAFTALGLAPSAAPSYKVIQVQNGGTITGTVTLVGTIPPPPLFPVKLYPFSYYCKKIADENGNVHIEEFNVGPDGGLQDAVIEVEGVHSGKPFPEMKSEFIATDCMFHPADVSTKEMYRMDAHGHMRHIHPLVSVIRNDSPFTVINKDPIFHNGQVFEKENGHIMLNFPLPVSDKPRGGILHFERGMKLAEMVCGMHEFMQSWALLVDNPYFAKTKMGGKFIIDQLPPGTYKVFAWHPHMEPIVKEITVPPNGTVSLNFVMDASQVKRRTFETRAGVRSF